jgi:hypothetical protein
MVDTNDDLPYRQDWWFNLSQRMDMVGYDTCYDINLGIIKLENKKIR